MHPKIPITFPNQFHTCKQIAHSMQLHFSSLNSSTWFYILSSSIPHCIESFPTSYLIILISITSQPLGWQIRDILTFQIWCPCIHTPLGMTIITLQCSSVSIPLWLFLISSVSALFIVFCIYCTHLLQKYKFILCLTVHNWSEIVSKLTQNLCLFTTSYFASYQFSQTHIHFT